MKKLLLLFLFIFVFALPANAFNPLMVCTGAVASSGTCTIGSGDNWVNAVATDYWTASTTVDQNFQEVANGSSKDICKIVLSLRNFHGVANDTTLILKDATNTTTYGTSDTVELSANTDTCSQFTYTFSPPVTVTTDFNVVFSAPDLEVNVCGIATSGDSDKYFGGTSYKATTKNTERNNDWAMEIWYEQ